MPLPDPSGAEPPREIHLLPAGAFSGEDGRGPYRVADAAALIAASMAKGKLPLDENHATDLAQRTGGVAPARGWITALHAREDGIWATVDWTRSGAELMRDRAYRGVSPVFAHVKDGTVTRIARASLTNVPNLTLTSLHTQQDTHMDIAKLRAALGLPETADEAAVLAAIADGRSAVSLHSQQLASIARAAGQPETATAETLVTALQGAGGKNPEVLALQSQLATLETERKREKAERAIEKARQAGKPVRPDQQDRIIALHMQNPADAEWMLEQLPSLHAGGIDPKRVRAGAASTDDDATAAGLLGLDPAKLTGYRTRGAH